MKKVLIPAITLLIAAPLAAKCIGCLVPHVEHQPNGQKVEWTEIKCQATQKDLEGDTITIKEKEVCPGCKCPVKSHSLHRQPELYFKGVKQPVRHLKSVVFGPIPPK